jgi:hypothetical protein
VQHPASIGLALALTTPLPFGGQLEAYWPLPKSENVIAKPALWGTAELK